MQPTDPKHRAPQPTPKDEPQVSDDGVSDGTLDLDDGDQINNQHLEVR